MSRKISPLTRFDNGIQSFLVDENHELKTANYTVMFTFSGITSDSGKTFVSKLDGIIYNMPPIVFGNVVTFVNMAEDGQAELSISPDASDAIAYLGTVIDDKDLINAKATSKMGDFVTLQSLNLIPGSWSVSNIRGIWNKEA